MNSGSRTVSWKALRRATTLSKGGPGVVASGPPTVTARDMISSKGLSSSRTNYSRNKGTSGNAGSLTIPTCISGLISFLGTHEHPYRYLLAFALHNTPQLAFCYKQNKRRTLEAQRLC
jgi:hypothetical protein